MKLLTALTTTGARSRALRVGGMSILLFSVTSLADMPGNSAAEHATAGASDATKEMVGQTTTLSGQAAKLVAAVRQIDPGSWRTKLGSSIAVAMDDGGEMGSPPAAPGGAMGMQDDQMGGMPPGGAKPAMPPSGRGGGMRGMAAGNAGMQSGDGAMPAKTGCCKGEMGKMGGTQRGGMAGMPGPPSAMPGYPGMSHLYHMGSTGFFLNHQKHITLTADQTMALYHIKEKALLERMTQQRSIDQAEQDLYTLTGVDQLDAAAIQAKIVEIEKLRGEQRMNFIRAVAEAANVLTQEQRYALMGMTPPKRK